MAGAAFSIKLRCASWQQLATIYKRDLSKGSMFLKASSQPPIGTLVKIDLELPSATVIELQGSIAEHVVDPQRGTGVTLKLEPLPTKSVWMIESALAAANKAGGEAGAAAPASPERPSRPATLADGEEISAAEQELIHALEAEAESLRKLNPFLVLGVGYETTDADVRGAFGELTKRYHPDRFARYQSAKLRQIAAEIFILIRDAYRRLADEKSRQQVVATLGHKPGGARPPSFPRPGTPPPVAPTPPPPPPKKPGDLRVGVPAAIPPKVTTNDVPTVQSPHDMPTNQSSKPAELASTELAKVEQVAAIVDAARAKTPAHGVSTDKLPPSSAGKTTGRIPVEGGDGVANAEALIDEGKLDEALAAYRVLQKKNLSDKSLRAGVELCEGLKALSNRDRLEAAQRFEAALELDPGNERAARELADMRRHATNERKGLLSRLMGKKEPPP